MKHETHDRLWIYQHQLYPNHIDYYRAKTRTSHTSMFHFETTIGLRRFYDRFSEKGARITCYEHATEVNECVQNCQNLLRNSITKTGAILRDLRDISDSII